jgi:2-polyprenyl-6-methoxyphenol hydroxylase-like FAD-dependent oxidoreductase
MVPRGSNGAGQAIIDARFLAGRLKKDLGVGNAALESYDQERVKTTTDVVLTNRRTPPDAILREVLRAFGRPAFRPGSMTSCPTAELQAISDAYKRVAGYDPVALKARASYL